MSDDYNHQGGESNSKDNEVDVKKAISQLSLWRSNQVWEHEAGTVNMLIYFTSIVQKRARKIQRSHGRKKGILLPHNYIKFPLLKVIVSKILF